MHFNVLFADNSQFGSRQGYWDDVPNDGIKQVDIELPFVVNKKKDDGTFEALPPSKVSLSGFESYYLANRSKSVASVGQSAHGGTIQHLGMALAGFDRSRDLVVYIEVDNQGNVATKHFGVEEFLNTFNPPDSTFRKGLDNA